MMINDVTVFLLLYSWYGQNYNVLITIINLLKDVPPCSQALLICFYT